MARNQATVLAHSAGVVQPHSLMLAAIAATWASVWVRAFLAYGDQPIDPPPLDLVGRPRPVISGRLSRAYRRAGAEELALSFAGPQPAADAAVSHPDPVIAS